MKVDFCFQNPTFVIFTAPETRSGLPHHRHCGRKADVWSCGALLYTMVIGHGPLEHGDEQQVSCFARINLPVQILHLFMIAALISADSVSWATGRSHELLFFLTLSFSTFTVLLLLLIDLVTLAAKQACPHSFGEGTHLNHFTSPLGQREVERTICKLQEPHPRNAGRKP